VATVEPAAIVNATGAWVDQALASLPVPSRRLMGGTKGSHFVTYHPPLAELLGGHGVYTEARDGRPVFVLPFGKGTLVGTTDIPFEGDPASVVATEQELEYLLAVVRDIFPSAGLAREHIAMHQCGVRPLPFVDAKTPAAITRRHQLVWNESSRIPLVSLVGGKLTTCRSLAEETAAAVFQRLGRKALANSRDRYIPAVTVDDALAADEALERAHLWALARWACEHEWATQLEDLVERRLMLHLGPRLTKQTLATMADAMVQEGKLGAGEAPAAMDRCASRLKAHFGLELS
jgi:glycerol-3-phosphate dehydrogenase